MSDRALQDIQRLQKIDVAAANVQLMKFLHQEIKLPFEVKHAELRPAAVSLNSINGVLYLTDNSKKFFKTHIEPDSIIGEYYNAELLAKAGYPVIQPIFTSTEYGKQFLIYDYFEASSVFDMLYDIEAGKRNDSNELIVARQQSDDLLAQLYAKTLAPVDAETHAKQPIHQLFLNRLVGPRFNDFYGGEFVLPEGRARFAELSAKQWIINGRVYKETLLTLIEKAKSTLEFHGQKQILAVTGHGDAHAGNLFYFGPKQPLTYFDPAFAGTHSPLLDLIKPVIHDSLLKWLYFPDEIAQKIEIFYCVSENRIEITHDFQPSELRQEVFASKLKRLIKPILQLLNDNKDFPQDWQAIVQAAAMCCPLLTMNLADRTRFKPEIGLLGLATTMELGGQSQNSNQPTWFEQNLLSVAPC